MLKAAHITEAFEGGVLTYLTTMLPRLVSLGCDVTLICSVDRKWPDGDTAIAYLRDKGVKVEVISMSKRPELRLNALAFLRLIRVFSRQRFDLVHTHASVAGALGRIAARMASINTVFHTPHCYSFLRSGAWGSFVYPRIEKILSKLTTLTIAVSHDEAGAAMNSGIAGTGKCIVLENCLDDSSDVQRHHNSSETADIKQHFGIPLGSKVVTLVGRLVDYKGVFDFLDAARLCRYNDAVFVIAGDGPLRAAVEKWVDGHLPNGKVRILGHVSVVDDLYHISDVVVSCSHAEGLPYVLLEAMRAGRAIVATNVPGNASAVIDDSIGCLVPPDPVSMSRAIEMLLEDPDLRRRYGENARSHFLRNHLADNAAQRLVEIYREWGRPSASRRPTPSSAKGPSR